MVLIFRDENSLTATPPWQFAGGGAFVKFPVVSAEGVTY
jgi:hypothetical protein